MVLRGAVLVSTRGPGGPPRTVVLAGLQTLYPRHRPGLNGLVVVVVLVGRDRSSGTLDEALLALLGSHGRKDNSTWQSRKILVTGVAIAKSWNHHFLTKLLWQRGNSFHVENKIE